MSAKSNTGFLVFPISLRMYSSGSASSFESFVSSYICLDNESAFDISFPSLCIMLKSYCERNITLLASDGLSSSIFLCKIYKIALGSVIKLNVLPLKYDSNFLIAIVTPKVSNSVEPNLGCILLKFIDPK